MTKLLPKKLILSFLIVLFLILSYFLYQGYHTGQIKHLFRDYEITSIDVIHSKLEKSDYGTPSQQSNFSITEQTDIQNLLDL